MGSGSPLKDWPHEAWRQLARQLRDAGHRLVFTGSGASEEARIADIVAELPDSLNLCGLLPWPVFVSTVSSASLLIGVDSVAGHVAAALRIPSLTIGHGMNNPAMWRPVSSTSMVMMHVVSCAPCYRNQGCATMDCIRLISPDEVFAKATQLLGHTAAA
jgi:heptosyltransferase-2